MSRKHLLAAVPLAALLLGPAARAADPAPGEFAIPGTQTTLKLYGAVQLDATVDFAGRPAGYEGADWATILGAVPADDTPASERPRPQTYLTARTSRIGLQTRTPSALGDVQTRIEADFNGPNDFQSETYTNSVLFRLRHAYATLGGLLVGQTWTTFIDLNAAPDTVDFNGPGTLALVRNPQIRYTLALPQGLGLALALENNRGPQYGVDTRFQTLPDVHANLGWAGDRGTASVRAVLQTYNRARLTGAGDYADLPVKRREAVGVAASGSLKLGGDTLVAQFVGGPGIGRYVFNSATIGDDSPGVSVDPATGKITLWSVWGAHAGYTHVWNPSLRSNLVGAYTWVVDPKVGGVKATNAAQKDFTQVFVNTFYKLTGTAQVGLEYGYGRWRSFTNGTPELHGTQSRINASFHYDFF